MSKKIEVDVLPLNDIQVTCSTCGHTFEVVSTKSKLFIDVCSHCHPFYTGANTYSRIAGRVEKFNRKYAKTKNTIDK